jgi:hypothetical protein
LIFLATPRAVRRKKLLIGESIKDKWKFRSSAKITRADYGFENKHTLKSAGRSQTSASSVQLLLSIRGEKNCRSGRLLCDRHTIMLSERERERKPLKGNFCVHSELVVFFFSESSIERANNVVLRRERERKLKRASG